MQKLSIELDESSWETANFDLVKETLHSSAHYIYKNLKDNPTYRILVSHQRGGCPMTRYRKPGEETDTVVLTNSPLEYKAQIMYQFAHEFCHVITDHNYLRSDSSKNGWFHESLSELASIFTMYQSGSVEYVTYVDHQCLSAAKNMYSRIESDQFAVWLLERENFLRNTDARVGYCRKWNAVVAYRLLEIFEKHPEIWNCVRYLPKSDSSIKQYLKEWETTVNRTEKHLVDCVSMVLTRTNI